MLKNRNCIVLSCLIAVVAASLFHSWSAAYAQPWPESDPNNTGGWIVNPTFTDEFNGTSLDSNKWHNKHTHWGGRAPGPFDAGNVSVSGGLLRLKTIHQSFVKNGSFEKGSFEDWDSYGAGTKSLATATAEHHRDRYAVKIVGGPGGVEQTVTGLLPNTQYKFSGYARISAAGVTATLGVKSTSGTVITSKAVTDMAFPENKSVSQPSASLTFTTGAGVTSVIVYAENSGALGTVWADEISLCPKTLATGFPMTGDNYFTCASVQSKTRASAGYYECSMKAANASHSSSFWFIDIAALGGYSEIDVTENNGNSTRNPANNTIIPMNVHYYPFGRPGITNHDTYQTGQPTAADFRIYGVEWNASRIKYYYNGQLMRDIPIPTNPDPAWEPFPFQLDQFLLFDTEIFQAPGMPLDGTNSEMQVDYVRGWTKSLVPDAIYKIYPVHAQNKRLDVSGVSTSPGANVHIWDDLNEDNQRWKAIDMGGGAFQLQPQHALGQRLEANGSGLNANVRQNTASTSSLAQRWHLIPVGLGAVEVISGNALAAGVWQRRLEAAGGASANGTNVRLGDDVDQGHQRWVFQRQP